MRSPEDEEDGEGWLEAIGLQARADLAALEGWSGVTEGAPPPPEAVDAAPGTEAALLAAALAPMTEAEEGALLDSALAAVTAEQAPEGARILRFPHKAWWGLSALAVAAAVLIFALPGGAVLPDYTVSGLSGAREVRSDGAPMREVPRYRAGDPLSGVLRPATPTEEAVELQAWWYAGHGRPQGPLQAWSPSWVAASSGAVRLQGLMHLDAAPGPISLVFVVASEGSMPEPGEVAQQLTRSDDRLHPWQIIRAPILWEAAP